MNQPLRLAGAAALCAALLLTGCAKKTDQTTTSTDTTGTQAAADAGATPASGASEATAAPGAGTTPAAEISPSAAPDASATTAAASTTTTTASNGASGGGGFITLPIYPGATPAETGSMTGSSSTGSVDIKIYQTKDDGKKVVAWYKAHLPSSFENFTISSGGKTTGTFADEHKDGNGDQSVIVTADDTTNQTRIQLTTKHGK
ncbi:MAG TPA: hypothetical protein VHS78_19835 [Candidatus Elarobacter sp.]|jgi:hypothetical protein|nr:hypothetical protein [Candidatus Elarobacter sp.]